MKQETIDAAIDEVARVIHDDDLFGCSSMDRPGQRPNRPHVEDFTDAAELLDLIKVDEKARLAVARFLRGPVE